MCHLSQTYLLSIFAQQTNELCHRVTARRKLIELRPVTGEKDSSLTSDSAMLIEKRSVKIIPDIIFLLPDESESWQAPCLQSESAGKLRAAKYFRGYLTAQIYCQHPISYCSIHSRPLRGWCGAVGFKYPRHIPRKIPS